MAGYDAEARPLVSGRLAFWHRFPFAKGFAAYRCSTDYLRAVRTVLTHQVEPTIADISSQNGVAARIIMR